MRSKSRDRGGVPATVETKATTTASSSSSTMALTSSSVSDLVNDVMEQTLTSTSRVIADWMRDGVAAPTVADVTAWMDCNHPNQEQGEEQQPATILIEQPMLVSPIEEEDEEEYPEDEANQDIDQANNTAATRYVSYKGSVATSGVCCAASFYPMSTTAATTAQVEGPRGAAAAAAGGAAPPSRSDETCHDLRTRTSKSPAAVTFDLPGCEDNHYNGIPTTSAPPKEYQFVFDDAKTPQYKTGVDGSSGGTHSARSRRSYYTSDTSIRTDRTSKTDLQSIHSFLMVSHAPIPNHPLLQQWQNQTEPRQPPKQRQPIRHQSHYLMPEEATVDSHNEEPIDHVLSPNLMQQLQRAFPTLKRGDSFWLQYSLVRDGASLPVLLEKVTESVKHSVLAIETTEGEVFGAFFAHPWRRSQEWYGSGESFLWTTAFDGATTRSSRNRSSKKKQAEDTRKIKVFKYSFANPYVQLCTGENLFVGSSSGDDADFRQGFGIAVDGDLMIGSSHPCKTFSSPSLSALHADGSSFEIRNLEVWNLTPCLSMVEKEGQAVVHRRRKTKRHHHGRRQNDIVKKPLNGVVSIDEYGEVGL